MKNNKPISYLMLVTALLCFGCRESVKKQNNLKIAVSSLLLNDGDEKYLAIDTKESVVIWKGSMSFGSNFHTGYVSISKGKLLIENGELRAGTVEVDMNTIVDENHDSNNNLIEHLKNADFFEVNKFPFSTIAITKVASTSAENKEITGNLTIKGITHPVRFPAKVAINNGIINANAKLVIDRTKWNIRYKSGKFFKNLADQTMSDSIELIIKIVAKNK